MHTRRVLLLNKGLQKITKIAMPNVLTWASNAIKPYKGLQIVSRKDGWGTQITTMTTQDNMCNCLVGIVVQSSARNRWESAGRGYNKL